MGFKIGFSAGVDNDYDDYKVQPELKQPAAPRKSLVEVFFSGRNMTLTYYNDQFDLHSGDMVYVDGKLEGLLGRVVEVTYNFKIKLSDYKRVIALVDTTVHGQFFMAASHFVTFDRNAIPADKVALWFRAPSKDDEEFVIGGDDTSFNLHDLKSMRISNEIANRGQDYYIENRVRYISIDEHRAYAIVQGTVPYEVEFEYYDGEIRHLTCNCFCSYNCKHEFAAMLQLRETLELIDKYYASEYSRSGYFAAVIKGTLFTYAINGKEHGSFSL